MENNENVDKNVTLLRFFVDQVLTDDSSEKDSSMADFYETARKTLINSKKPEYGKDLLAAFPERIHSNIKTKQELNNKEYNPLRVEILLRDALVRFETCNGYDDSHKTLQQQAVNVLERIYTRRKVRLEEIKTRKKILKEEEKWFIKKSDDSFPPRVDKATYPIISALDGIIHDNFEPQRRTDRVNNTKGLYVDDIPNKQGAAERLELMKIDREQNETNIQVANIRMRKTRIQESIKLENKLETAEETLAKNIEFAYLNGGPLDFIPRFEILKNYYVTDFNSGLNRFQSAVIGLQFVYPKIWKKYKKDLALNPIPSLSKITILIRKILDDIELHSHKSLVTTLRYRFSEIFTDLIELNDGKTYSFKFSIPTFLLDKDVFVRTIECYLYNSNSYKEKTVFQLTASQQIDGIKMVPLVFSPQPDQSRILNTFDNKSVHNTKLESKWELRVNGNVKDLQNLEFITTVVAS